MTIQFEDIQKLGKENVDLALKSFSALSKGMQAIAVEVADYSKASFEDNAATFEKLASAKTLDKAIEIQTDAAKSAYETFVARTAKIGELVADLAKESYKPVEASFQKATSAK